MSNYVVEVATTPDAESQWETYVARHAGSTVYHRLAWRKIFEEGLGYRSWPLMARDAGDEIAGILPLYLVSGPPRSRLVAVPFRDRGGPLYDTGEALDALLVAARALAAGMGVRTIVLKSLDPLPEEAAQRHHLRRDDHWIHSRMPLTGLSAESLWKSIGPKSRNMIRQAQHAGLACATPVPDEAAMRRWHALHVTTQKRLGIPPFPERFFATMFSTLGDQGALALLEVVGADRPVAASILLLHAGTCVYGYSASSEEGQRLRANDLMLHGAISFALARGCTLFDLGSDSPVQESLLFFKRKWGAAQRPIPSYCTEGTPGLPDSSAARYTLARRILQRMPEPMLRFIGACVTRYFG